MAYKPKINLKRYVDNLIKRKYDTFTILNKVYKKKPFTSWEGINLADYINEEKNKQTARTYQKNKK